MNLSVNLIPSLNPAGQAVGEALAEAVKRGKCKSVGLSNYSLKEMLPVRSDYSLREMPTVLLNDSKLSTLKRTKPKALNSG